MWKMIIIGGLLWVSILIGGCSMINDAEEEMKYKGVEVHTEEEMKDFALQALKEKYDKEFEFIGDFTYEHEDGEDNRPIYLDGHAYVIGDKNLDCAFQVTEPNKFEDNYATNYYKEDIINYLRTSLKGVSDEYEIYVGYSINNKTFNPRMDFKKYLYNDNCCIYYTAYVKQTEDYHNYIPIIRQWMDILYQADYKWYFELHDIDDKDKYYFTLDPGDNGFDSTDDWKDESIYNSIISNVENPYWWK